MTERRIPTILGLLLLVVGVAAGVILVQRQQIFRIGASPEIVPKEVRVTNISDNSLTVSWITEKAVPGFLLWEDSKSTALVARDDQDSGEQPTSRQTHHVSLSALAPTTSYFFKIASGGQTFDSSGKPWEQKTAPPLAPRAADVISGRVETSTGLPAEGAIVFINLPASTTLSAVTSKEGRWSASLANARTTDLSAYANYNQTTTFSLFVQAGGGQVASAQVTVGNAKPTPPIILGQTHDFRKTPTEQDTTSPKSTIQLPLGAPSLPSDQENSFNLEPLASPLPLATPSGKITIDNPREAEKIATTKPEFRGKGPANATITITLESPLLTDKVKISSDGTWKWSPKSPLTTGSHKLTVSYSDPRGQIQAPTRNFTVLAAGSSLPALTATPSGEIATASPTPKPSPTSTPSARVSLPSTEGGVPVAGNLTITFLLFILGIVSIFAGLILFRKA